MRKSIKTIAVLVCLFLSQKGHALGKDVVNTASGADCTAAQTALVDLIRNGSNTYSADQAATGQFPTLNAFNEYCRVNGAVQVGGQYQTATKPRLNDSGMFPIPTYTRDIASAPCSYFPNAGGANVFYVGWKTSASCNQ